MLDFTSDLPVPMYVQLKEHYICEISCEGGSNTAAVIMFSSVTRCDQVCQGGATGSSRILQVLSLVLLGGQLCLMVLPQPGGGAGVRDVTSQASTVAQSL